LAIAGAVLLMVLNSRSSELAVADPAVAAEVTGPERVGIEKMGDLKY